MKAFKKSILTFGVMASFLMMSMAFIQPVSAQISEVKDYSKLISLSQELINNNDVKNILLKAQDAETYEELIVSQEELEKQDAFKEIEELVNSEYSNEIILFDKMHVSDSELKAYPVMLSSSSSVESSSKQLSPASLTSTSIKTSSSPSLAVSSSKSQPLNSIGTQSSDNIGLFLIRLILAPIMFVLWQLWALFTPLTQIGAAYTWAYWLINGVAP
jgi:hypothetical protein